jgi:hypothetical protein
MVLCPTEVKARIVARRTRLSDLRMVYLGRFPLRGDMAIGAGIA